MNKVFVISIIGAVVILIVGSTQGKEELVSFISLALSVATIPTIFATIYQHNAALETLSIKPNIQIGLVHGSKTYPDTTNLLKHDEITINRIISGGEVHLVVKNVGNKSARNFKFRIDRTSDAPDTRVQYFFSADMPIKAIKEGKNTDIFYGKQSYLGANDELVLNVDIFIPRETNQYIHTSKHIFYCRFWADDLEPHVEQSLHVTVTDPELEEFSRMPPINF